VKPVSVTYSARFCETRLDSGTPIGLLTACAGIQIGVIGIGLDLSLERTIAGGFLKPMSNNQI
jgi:hypothetical protein